MSQSFVNRSAFGYLFARLLDEIDKTLSSELSQPVPPVKIRREKRSKRHYAMTDEHLAALQKHWPTRQNRKPSKPAPLVPTPAVLASAVPPSVKVRTPIPDRVIDLRSEVVADFNQILSWAEQRGIKFQLWTDLGGINDKRRALGLPVFKRSETAVRGYHERME